MAIGFAKERREPPAWLSIEADVRPPALALPPAEDAEGGEEKRTKQGEGELNVALGILARVAVLFVLLLDRAVVVARVDRGAGDPVVGEVRFAQDLGARRDE